MLSPPASDALPAPDLPALKSSLANASKLERARNPLALLRFRNAAIQVRAQLDRSQLQLSRSSTRATLLDVALRSMYGDGSEGDRAHIAVAASLVAQAQNGTYDPAWFKRSTEWRHMREIYANRWFKALRFATIFVFMIMQFWEEPVWCRVQSPSTIFFNSYRNYAGIDDSYPQISAVARGEEGITPNTNPEPSGGIGEMPRCGSSLVYLLSNLSYWPIYATLLVELILLLCLLCTEVLLPLWLLCRTRAEALVELRRDRLRIVLLVLFGICIVDIIISCCGVIDTQTARLVPMVRPILFVCMVRGVRDCFASLVRGLPITLDVLCLLWVLIAVWAWICLLVFNPVNSLEGATWFQNLGDALWTIQVQLTTANYPDMQLPAYSVHRSWILLFVTSFVLGSYFLMPLILANIYFGYSKQQAATARHFEAKRKLGLADAFMLLDARKQGHVNFDTCMKLIMAMMGASDDTKQDPQLQQTPAAADAASVSTPPPGSSRSRDVVVQVELQPLDVGSSPPASPAASPAASSAAGDLDASAAPVVTSPSSAARSPVSPSSRIGLALSSMSFTIHELERKAAARARARLESKARQYFDLLDSDRSGTVQQEEFSELCSILSKELHTLSPPILPAEWPLWTDPRFLWFVDFLQRPLRWDLIVFVVTLFNVCVLVGETIYVRDNPVQTGAGMIYTHCAAALGAASAGVIPHAAVLHGLEFLCMAFYLLDAGAKLFCLGWNMYSQTARYCFEGFFTAVALICEIVLLVPPLGCNENVYALVMVLRVVLRVLRLVLFFPRLYLILAVYLRLLPRFLCIVGLLVSLFYTFASLGVWLFGGRIYIGNPRQIGACYDSSCNYYAINCNDFAMCSGALFQIMVLSNWHLQVDGFVLGTSKWSRLFFLIFYYLCVLIVLNLCIAFLLDAFITEWKEARREQKERQAATKAKRSKHKRRASALKQASSEAHHAQEHRQAAASSSSPSVPPLTSVRPTADVADDPDLPLAAASAVSVRFHHAAS